MTKKTKIVHFSIEGEWFTDLLRSLWSEHSETKAINIWNSSFPQYSTTEYLNELFIPLVSGKKKFIGVDELKMIDDSISEMHGMPLFDCVEDALKYHHAKLVIAELEYTFHKLNARFMSIYDDETEKLISRKFTEYQNIHNKIINLCEHFDLSKVSFTNTSFLNNGNFIEKRGLFREWYLSTIQYFRNKYGHNLLDENILKYDEFFYKEKTAKDREERGEIYRSFINPPKPKYKPENCLKTEFTSGWMSPGGYFYGCGDFNHVNFTEDLCKKLEIEIDDNKGDQETLEDLKYIKVSMRRFYWTYRRFVVSQAQIESMKKLMRNWEIEETQFNDYVSTIEEAIEHNKEQYRIYKGR